MAKVENFPYSTQDLEMIKKYGTSCPFDWKYMFWRIKLAQKWFNKGVSYDN